MEIPSLLGSRLPRWLPSRVCTAPLFPLAAEPLHRRFARTSAAVSCAYMLKHYSIFFLRCTACSTGSSDPESDEEEFSESDEDLSDSESSSDSSSDSDDSDSDDSDNSDSDGPGNSSSSDHGSSSGNSAVKALLPKEGGCRKAGRSVLARMAARAA